MRVNPMAILVKRDHGRREPVSSRRDGMRSIRLTSSRTEVGTGRRWATEPSMSISTRPKSRGRSRLRSGPLAVGIGVGKHDDVALDQRLGVGLEHAHLLDEARVVGGVGEDDQRPGDPAQLVERRLRLGHGSGGGGGLGGEHGDAVLGHGGQRGDERDDDQGDTRHVSFPGP